MSLLKKKYEIAPNTLGFLYRNHQFEKTLTPGIYKIKDWKKETNVYTLPTTPKLITTYNQEVLTKDNISLRFSFNVWYRIADGIKFLQHFSLDRSMDEVWHEATEKIHNTIQLEMRNRIAQMDSEAINDNREALSNIMTKEMQDELGVWGIQIDQASLKDLTFPRNIQQLFAKHLESKIRAKADLENARTTVATARALKNAAELMKDHENIKFLQLLELYQKMSEKGKNTFVMGHLLDPNSPK